MQVIETNEAAQTHGLLDITLWTGIQNFRAFTETVKLGVPVILFSLPFRFCAIHLCSRQGPSPSLTHDDSNNNLKSMDTGSNTTVLSPQQQILWQSITEVIVKQVGVEIMTQKSIRD